MSHSTGGFNHEIEYNYASLFKYLYYEVVGLGAANLAFAVPLPRLSLVGIELHRSYWTCAWFHARPSLLRQMAPFHNLHPMLLIRISSKFSIFPSH